jgi:V8-like Glu-specific endopeptidase
MTTPPTTSSPTASPTPRALAGPLLAVVAVLALLAPSTGAAAADPGEVALADQAPTAKEADQIATSWTGKQLANAKPLDRPDVVGGLPLPDPPGRAPVLVPPVAPKLKVGKAPAAARLLSGSPWNGPGDQRPAVTIGRLFFDRHGTSWTCSATVVTAFNHDLLLTAGHCVFDWYHREWSTRMIFVPAYRDGDEPQGRWVVRKKIIPRSLYEGSDHAEDDRAALALRTNASGWHIADWVGTQGVVFYEQRAGTLVHDFGYPAASPYDGRRLIYCRGRIRDDDGLACDMTAGASGGPWLSRFDGTSGYVMSTNCCGRGVLYGAPFEDGMEHLYRVAERL